MVNTRTLPPLPSSRAFTNFPTFSQWKSASKVGGRLGKPYRREDKALLRIDRMVKSLNRRLADGARCYRLAGLFFTTMWWVNNHKYDPKMHLDRRRAILSLNLTVSRDLSRALGCGHNVLATRLQELYGTGMSDHGVQTDAAENPEYMSAAERESYRVIFKGGRAYHFKYDNSSSTPELVPHDTQNLISTEMDDNNRDGIIFVMSMSHQLYAGISGSGGVREPMMDEAQPHYLGMKKVIYHSCFLRGFSVLCAGTISFDNGIIVGIRNDSGHYQPRDTSMAKMLQHLKTIGVDISKITVFQEKRHIDKQQGFINSAIEHAKATDTELQAMMQPEHRDHNKQAIGNRLTKARKAGAHAAEADATCPGDVFLRHYGDWDAIRG
ncbi:MAG: hypothetical protein ABW148_03610 [Sedimenticola sp.]